MNRIFCLLIFINPFLLNAQSNIHFENYTEKEGLPSNTVNCLHQDNRGFIWIGTINGLTRFDGQHFYNFKHEPDNNYSLYSNNIGAIVEKDSILWIGASGGGLSSYDFRLTENKEFRNYFLKNEDANKDKNLYLSNIDIDSYGRLWMINSSYYMLSFDLKSKSFLWWTKNSVNPPFQNNRFNVVKSGLDDELWIGMENRQLIRMNSSTKKIFPRYFNIKDLKEKMISGITDILQIDHGKKLLMAPDIWGLLLYDIKRDTVEFFDSRNIKGLPDDEFTKIIEDQKNTFWIGSQKSGLIHLDLNSRTAFNVQHNKYDPKSLVSNNITCLLKDKAGILWIGTQEGLGKYDPSVNHFQNISLTEWMNTEPLKHYLTSMIQIPDGRYLIGTNRMIFISDKYFLKINEQKIYSDTNELGGAFFFKDGKGTFWIGSKGFHKLDPSTFKTTKLDVQAPDSLRNFFFASRFNAVIEDTIAGEPVWWMGGWRSAGIFIYYINSKKIQFFPGDDSDTKKHSTNTISRFVKDIAGRLWFVTKGGGLHRINNPESMDCTRFTSWGDDSTQLQANIMSDIIADRNGNFWITSVGGGLSYLDKKDFDIPKFRHFGLNENLPHVSLYNIFQDRRDNLWISSQSGILCFNPLTKNVICYSILDGLTGSRFVQGAYEDNSGYFHFFLNSEIVRFHPDSIVRNNKAPDIYITSFKIFDKPYDGSLHEKISLDYSQNFFTIEFSALNYSQSNKNSYAYKLDGIDKEWVNSKNQNKAIYTNVPGGEYLFHVKAANNDGVWNETGSTLSIIVAKPFWKREWFIMILISSVLLILYMLHRFRLKQIIRVQKERERFSMDLHDDLGSGLTSIRILSEMSKTNPGNKEYYEKISNIAYEMIDNMRNIIWTMKPEHNSLSELIRHIKEFGSEILELNNIDLKLVKSSDITDRKLNIETVRNVTLVVKECLHNVIKHAQASIVNIHIKVFQKNLEITISDDGRGFNEVGLQQHGNGIKNMRKRIEKINGTIQFINGGGTTVLLNLPI